MRRIIIAFFALLLLTAAVASADQAWDCPTCGTKGISTAFCGNCGTKAVAGDWNCPGCGTKNTGNFCQNCGTRKPDGAGGDQTEAAVLTNYAKVTFRGETVTFYLVQSRIDSKNNKIRTEFRSLTPRGEIDRAFMLSFMGNMGEGVYTGRNLDVTGSYGYTYVPAEDAFGDSMLSYIKKGEYKLNILSRSSDWTHYTVSGEIELYDDKQSMGKAVFEADFTLGEQNPVYTQNVIWR